MTPSPQQQPEVVRVPVLRLRAEPRSTNAHGRVHAGWLMFQIDTAGAICAERLAKGPVTTVAVNAFQLTSPIHVGDVVQKHQGILDAIERRYIVVDGQPFGPPID